MREDFFFFVYEQKPNAHYIVVNWCWPSRIRSATAAQNDDSINCKDGFAGFFVVVGNITCWLLILRMQLLRIAVLYSI